MQKTTILIVSAFIVLTGKLSAQQLSPMVVAPSGGFYSNTTGMLSFTTGELAAVETFTSPSIILTQGFQQFWDLGTYVIDQPVPNFLFRINPNLSDGIFYLTTESKVDGRADVSIMDLLGREILSSTFYLEQGTTTQPFDISGATQGMYLVMLTIKENNHSVADHFIEKIQIIK